MMPLDAPSLFPPHCDGARFFNPNAPSARGLLDVLRWKLTSRADRSPAFVPDVSPTVPPRSIEGTALRVTLVNHSTVLMQQRGCNILTDPLWSRRAGPFPGIGPRRRRDPGVRWLDLPPIDIVLLSHNHYDHLDLATLHGLSRCGQPRFVVPLGVGRLLRSQNIVPFHEVDWGDSLPLAGVTIDCVPAQHFSGRGFSDRDRTLWCGYVFQAPPGPVYFAGDTAFGDHFGLIRERFGAPRLSLLPIGAYEPRWFMAAIHMAPEEAVRAHQILGSATSIAIHHGTFQLSDDGLNTPRRRLSACAPGESFLVLNNGESVTIE
ncbi:MAG TPA: MBL fold metallo-hydrolase [Bryobacteraceae bacterium]|nr:MBL fold metallo-hydrolase [Bryobacteraceae bacterium]